MRSDTCDSSMFCIVTQLSNIKIKAMRTMEDIVEGPVRVLPLVRGAGELRMAIGLLIPQQH